ncbi:hypothetical protein EMPS_07263 [Entomortierella parvispora]|uniref:Uncharacterized protein n=1 Tax=Entomortierella parvispora TaxID=205924 RepID=A0A9P3LYI7_9FUNG|nr:hypothetical protein EMPS_07263 [Entomortierella parvispora]
MHILENASKDPRIQSCGEKAEKALWALRNHGLRADPHPVDPRSSVAHFITQNFLQPRGKFDLQLSVNSSDNPVLSGLPTRTQLLFVFLAERLNCKIFLFSSRGKPRVYCPTREGPSQPRVCGFFHRVDSFLKFSEYLVLVPIDNFILTPMDQVVGDLVVAPVSELVPSSVNHSSPVDTVSSPTNAATFRANKRKIHYGKGPDDNMKAELLVCFEESCYKHLEVKIQEHIGKLNDSKNKEVEGKQEFKQRLLNQKSLPKGPLVDAADIYINRNDHPMKRSKVTSDITTATNKNNLRIWCNVVEAKFDNIWEECEKNLGTIQAEPDKGKKRKGSNPDEGGEPKTPIAGEDEENDDDWRTCTVTLKQILHPSLSNDEDYGRILKLLHEAQAHVTDVERSLYLLAQIGTILAGAGACMGQDSTLDLTNVLPPGYIVSPEQRIIHVAPVATQQAGIENKNSGMHSDIRNLLSQNHLSNMHTVFKENGDGRKGKLLAKSGDGHPKWRELSTIIDNKVPGVTIPYKDGFSSVVEAHTRQCSTAIKNLWEGNVYEKALDYLLRYLLSAWLAPNRAAAHKERKIKAVKNKEEKKSGEGRHSRQS